MKQKVADAKKLTHLPFWILGHSLDPSMMPFEVVEGDLNVLQRFDCDVMDEVEKEFPVMILSASGHTFYINTAALFLVYEKAKPDYDTFEAFRKHVNDAGGLQEMEEMNLALSAVPLEQLHQAMLQSDKSLDSFFKLARERGVTLMYDAAMSEKQLHTLAEYLKKYPSSVRIGYALLCSSVEEAQQLDPYKPLTEMKQLYQGSVKIISDGSNQGLTGYQHEAYLCEPADNTGLFNFSEKDFKDIVKIIVSEKKWPVNIHANGNKAIDLTLSAYEAALGGESGLTKRHRIEHCSLLDDEAIEKLFNLGISPSFLIGHVGYWGYAFKNGIFEEKADLLNRCQSVLQKGIRLTLHTDFMVSPLGPLRLMEQSITRIMEQDPQGKALNEGEKITPAQALRAVTYDAAWQCHVDKWVGSLEIGKLADYVILAEDPITKTDPVGIRNINVLETWIGGIQY